MEWVQTGHHYAFEHMNRGYDFLRRTIVNYGAEATNRLKQAVLNAVLRKDVFEVQSKVKTFQGTDFPPMSQSSLSFYDDFRILAGIPVFVLRPPEFVDRAEDGYFANTGLLSPNGSPSRVEAQSPIADAPHFIKCGRFSIDGKLFVTGHHDGTVMIWDADHGKLQKTLSGPHRSPIADIQFYKDSHILVVCDFACVMSIWDVVDETREPVVVNGSANWEKTRMPSVEGHWPKISSQGTLLVCPVQVVIEQKPGQPQGVLSPRRTADITSISRLHRKSLLRARVRSGKGPGNSFAHFCILHIFDTREEGITRAATFGDSEGRIYNWGRSLDLRPISKLFIPLLSDAHDYALSSTEISDNGKGLLIGVSGRPNGHLIVWPDFLSREVHSYRLEGMVGRWSPCSRYVASWDAPLKNTLGIEAGVCRLWDVECASQWEERCAQNGDEEHPRFFSQPSAELTCPSGNPIYWCDFVSLEPERPFRARQMGVATCSVGDHVQLVMWDLKGIPVQTYIPGICRKDVILHTQQAWADRWILVKPSWGLNFISISEDRTRLGFLSVEANKGIVYDTEKRTEKLWISLTDKNGDIDTDLCKDMDFIMGPLGDRFVTLCEDSLMIWLPQVLHNQEDRGACWSSLESSDRELVDGKLRCKFSRDGNTIGLMRLYSTVMDIWNLKTGRRTVLSNDSAQPDGEGTVNSPFRSFEHEDDDDDSQEGTPLSVISPTTGVAAAQRKWFCQFCISKSGDHVATCMGDMSVLLWDLTTGIPTSTQVATLDSRYCAAWAVCFAEGPGSETDTIVVCEDTGCLVWIAVYPYARIIDRKNADGKKRCTFSADGSRAVLMPDDIQVRVWDLIERVQLFSCTYQVWLGMAGQVPFPHNISMDGQSAFVGLNTAGKSVLCTKDTTYSELKEKPDQEKLCLTPHYVTVNEDASWVVTDEFREFDFDRRRKKFSHVRKRHSGRRTISLSSSTGRAGNGTRGSSSRAKYGTSKDGGLLGDAGPSSEPSQGDTAQVNERYPNIRERLCNDQLWDYLCDPQHAEIEDEYASNRLVVMHVPGKLETKQIFFPKLSPHRFIVSSADGTKVACMDQNGKLNVWTAHAAYGCIPTSQTLLVSSDVDHSFVEGELDKYGPGILNYQDHAGLSLLLHAVYRRDVALLKCLLAWAKRHDVKVSLRNELADISNGPPQELNALNLALGYRSPEVTRVIMKYLLEGVCTEVETSVILKDSLAKLSGVYPSILLKILDNKRIMLRLHEMNVPEWAFARSEYKVHASDELIPTAGRLEDMWLQKRLAKQEGVFRKSVFKRTSAYACVMPYPDIAQLGMRGILRPLLFNRVPHHIFSTLPIRCVIKFKWSLYGKRLIVEDCVHYLALLFFFTLYALLLGFFTPDDDESQEVHNVGFYKDGTVAALIICVFLGLGTLLRKFHQLHVLWESGGWKGIWYWFTDYFNVLEMLTYVSIVILTPLAHIRNAKSRVLASLVAATCIFLWAKNLYYAQAFKGTGPLVIMIREIVKDIRFYLFVLFAILMGFAVAFFVLFRNAQFAARNEEKDCLNQTLSSANEADRSTTEDRENDGSNRTLSSATETNCSTTEEDIKELFGSFDRTMITMFSMMLGEVSDAAGLLFKVNPGLRLVGILMFVAYLLAVTIVLLNLLIAIMGDGFDRVKAMDTSYFLKKRAQVIDDMELGLTKERQEEISAQIKEYLHVLMPKHRSEVHQHTGEWQGIMKDVQTRFKQELSPGADVTEMLKEMNERLNLLENGLEALRPPSFAQGLANPLSALLDVSVLPGRGGEGVSVAHSRSHGGGLPVRQTEDSEGSDLEDLFGNNSDEDTV